MLATGLVTPRSHPILLFPVQTLRSGGLLSSKRSPTSASSSSGRHPPSKPPCGARKAALSSFRLSSLISPLDGRRNPSESVVNISRLVVDRLSPAGDETFCFAVVVRRRFRCFKDCPRVKIHDIRRLSEISEMVCPPFPFFFAFQVLQYAPKAPNSRGGTMLLCQSDFFLGSRVAKVRLKVGRRLMLVTG